MANFSDFNNITGWNGQEWIYNIPGNYTGTAEGDITGAAIGDTFTIVAKDGGYPYVAGIPDFNEDVRWRPGTYNIIAVANSYDTPDGSRNMVRLDSMPLENRSGVQITHFSNPYISGGLGYLNNPSQVPLVAGTLSFGSRNGTMVTLTEAGSSGGTGFGKKLHRTVAPTDTISSDTVVATGNGPWTDALPDDALYYYFVEYYDNVNTTKTSNICAASRSGTQAPTLPVAKVGAPPKLAAIGVGDSNVFQGAFNAVPALLESIDARHDVTYLNTGVGGTRSGQWVTQSNLYQPALDGIAAGIAAGRTPFVIELVGTNDSVLDAVPAATYGTNVQALCDRWLNAGAEYVFLMQPAYTIPRKFNNSLNSVLALMLQYHTQLANIAADNPKIVYVPGLYRYIADHQDLIASDGVHFGGVSDIGARYATVAIANTVPATAVPGDGLTEEQVTAACLAALASIGINAGFVALVAAIKAKTDNLPLHPASVSDVQTASQNAAALAMTLGAYFVTLHFRDDAAAPVPFAAFQIVGQGYARADASGNATISLNAGTYTVQATGASTRVIFAPQDITVTEDGPNVFTLAAESVAAPEPALEPGTCVIYIDLAGYTGSEYGQLTIVGLPVNLGGRWLVNTSQRQTINTVGRIAFHPVPQGAVVSISIPSANITRRITVPDEQVYALLEEN